MIDQNESRNEAASCAQIEYDQRTAALGSAFSDLSHLPSKTVHEQPVVLGKAMTNGSQPPAKKSKKGWVTSSQIREQRDHVVFKQEASGEYTKSEPMYYQQACSLVMTYRYKQRVDAYIEQIELPREGGDHEQA